MNKKYEFGLMFPFGKEADSLQDRALMRTGICEYEPYGECEYDTTLLNVNYIDQYIEKESRVEGHVLIFQDANADRFHEFIEKIFNKCVLTENVYDAYEDFAIVECESYYWDKFGIISENGTKCYEPSLIWSFEDGTQNFSSDSVVFDERIVITISWPTDNGTESFQGSWYVTSPSFLKERLKKIDPYYRRHILIMEQFDKDLLVNQLHERLFLELRRIPIHVRTLFLIKNMEYVGQLMFYER